MQLRPVKYNLRPTNNQLQVKSGTTFQNTATKNWIFQAGYQGDARVSFLITQIKNTKIIMLSVVLSSKIPIDRPLIAHLQHCEALHSVLFQDVKTLTGPGRSRKGHRELIYTLLLPVTVK